MAAKIPSKNTKASAKKKRAPRGSAGKKISSKLKGESQKPRVSARKKTSKRLTSKQEKFTAEKIKADAEGRSLTSAAVAAGYSPATARQQASRLLTNVDIQARLRQRVERAKRAAKVENDEVIGVLAQQMHGDIADLLDESGRFDYQRAVESGVTSQIKKLRIKERKIYAMSEEIGVETTHELELYNAQEAAGKLADIFGLKQLPRENDADRERKTAIYEQVVANVIERAKAEASVELTREQAIDKIAVFDAQIRNYLPC